MKMSNMACRTRKSRNTDLTMLPSQATYTQANQIVRFSPGVYGWNTVLLKARHEIERIIRTVLEEYDCCEVELPILQSRDLWERSGRFNRYIGSGTMFTVNEGTNTLCLAPTAEEAALHFVEEIVESYKELPITMFQFGRKFRKEIRCQGGIMRSQEFLMMDAYSFSSSRGDMILQYQRMRSAFTEIFKHLGLEVIPVKALSGDMGGRYSEEFMCLTEHGEDVILYNEELGIAFNKELLKDGNAYQILNEYGITAPLESFVERRASELGHIFQLGTTYSESMDITFTDRDGKQRPYHMGCYGIGVSRVLGCIIENNMDNDGIIWPSLVAPYQFHIVCTESRKELAEKLYRHLTSMGFKVLFDDREKVSFGAKIKDWRILGAPYCFIIGNKTSEEATAFVLENRKTGEQELVQEFRDHAT